MNYSKYRPIAYEQELYQRFHARTPAKVFDAHFHLMADDIPGVPADKVFDAWLASTNEVLGPNRVQGGLMMASPKVCKTEEEMQSILQFVVDQAILHPEYVIGHVVRPEDDPAEVEKWLEKYPFIVALKPYRCYARAEDTYEADILDYAPEWMWELAEKWNLAVIIHLSHYGDMLKDPRNGEQIRYLSKKYPNAQMVLAHCAMGHHPDKLKSGLHYLEGLDNVWIDLSGVSEALSFIYIIKAFGTDKLFYGSDGYSFGQLFGRVMAMGGNFLGIHDDDQVELPPDYHYQPLTNVCENVQALYAAGDLCELTQQQWEDIFYNNADRLYNSRRRNKA